MDSVKYGRTYRDNLGYLVEVVPGATITRVSDRGTLDRRVVQVRPIDAPGEQQQYARKVGLTWSAPVDELVEVTRQERVEADPFYGVNGPTI